MNLKVKQMKENNKLIEKNNCKIQKTLQQNLINQIQIS